MNLKEFLKEFETGDFSDELFIISPSPFLKMYLLGQGYKSPTGVSFEKDGKKILVHQNIHQYASHGNPRNFSRILLDIDTFKNMTGYQILEVRSRVRYARLDDQKLFILRNPWDGEIQETNKGDFEVVSI